MFRLAYRNFGDHESLVTNQSVSGGIGPNGEVSGIRWWELRSPNSSPVIFQQGTYAPGLTDGIHRWMGSIAMDGEGNMALGYSAANNAAPAVFPSVNYTGRLAGSTLGTCRSVKGALLPEPARKPAAGTAGVITLRSRLTRRMISLSGTSTNGSRRQAPPGGDCASAASRSRSRQPVTPTGC